METEQGNNSHPSRKRKAQKIKSSHQHSQHAAMGQRGVTRPVDMHQKKDMSHEMGPPYSEQRHQMLGMHHKKTLWVYWTLIMLGIWTMLSPFTFGYQTGLVAPAGGREVWLSLESRNMAMTWSDILSGGALVIFGWRSLTPNRPYSLWISCFIGIWLSMAPIVFWAPSAAAYLNDTFVGAWVIALTVLIVGMPNMVLYMEMGPSRPKGWSYNPSSWPQRWIMIVTGFAGWLVSRYLAAYQLGYISHSWDPFFGMSTAMVLTSEMSRKLPISDAALGSLAYTFEFLMGFMGSPARWRTMPWMVTFFGILVIPLGLVHIFLVISQPVLVGAWCTFCLLVAALMLPMIPLEVDEVVAMGQFLKRAHHRGEPFWKIFWKGGSEPEAEPKEKDRHGPELMEISQHPGQIVKASIRGMSSPWNLILCALLGLWLVLSPLFFDAGKDLSDLMHVSGLLVITISVISMGEVIRVSRLFNVIPGLALGILSLTWEGSMTLLIHNWTLGLLIAALSLPKGKITEQYGTWDRLIR